MGIKSGIYKITNTANGKIYIGQSVDVQRRINDHQRTFAKGTHHSVHILRAYQKYGADAFKYEVIEYCSIPDLDSREIYWIKYYDSANPSKGYNMSFGGQSKHKYNADYCNRRRGEGNPMYGKKQSASRRAYQRQVALGSSDILDENIVRDIKTKLLSAPSISDIAKEYGVSVSTIWYIKECKNWDWVASELNQRITDAYRQKKIREKAEREEKKRRKKNNSIKTTRMRNKTKSVNIQLIRENDETEYTQKEIRANLIQAVREEYQAGVPRKEIQERYGISYTSWKRYTADLRKEANKKIDEANAKLIEEMRELRRQGMLVKDIAAKLSVHRTTVSKYTMDVKAG